MFTPLPHFDKVKGIDRSVEPHLIDKQCWYASDRVRFRRGKLSLIPRLSIYYTPQDQSVGTDVTAFACFGSTRNQEGILPYNQANSGYILALAGSSFYSITRAGLIKLDQAAAPTNARWSTHVHGGKAYCVNPDNPVLISDGSHVKKLVGAYVPAGRYISVFYDHIVVSNVNYNSSDFPFRTCWSDITNVDRWEPKRGSEADHHDCLETAQGAFTEINGQARLGDALYLYTATIIFKMSYVGLPRVMLTVPLLSGVGCTHRYGVAATDRLHFFPSSLAKTIYAFNGQELQDIGSRIKAIFPFTADAENRMWSFVREDYSEVWWVYDTTAYVYNYEEDLWFTTTTEGWTAFLPKGQDHCDISQFAFAYNPGVLSCPQTLGPLYGYKGASVLTESSGLGVLGMATPYLETGDVIHSSPSGVSEVCTLGLDANVDTGVVVKVLIRKFLTSSFSEGSWTTLSQVWTNALAEQRLTLPRSVGRVYRYRFYPQSTETSSEVLRTQSLSVKCDALVHKTFVLDKSASALLGTFKLPYAGGYHFTVVGAGGGGAARGLLPYEEVNYVDTPTSISLKYAGQRVGDQKIYGTRYSQGWAEYCQGNLYAILLTYDPAYPDPNNDPAVAPETSRELIAAALKAKFEQFAQTIGSIDYQALNYRFVRCPVPFLTGISLRRWLHKFAYEDGLPKDLLIDATRPWLLYVDGVFILSTTRKYVRVGGGAGAIASAIVTIADAKAATFAYRLGICHAGFETGADYTGRAGETTRIDITSGGAGTMQAGRGMPGTILSGAAVPGTGGVASASGAALSDIKLNNGDDATAEVPDGTGVVSVPAKGGTAWGFRESNDISAVGYADGTLGKTFRASDDQGGPEFGGGGCGKGQLLPASAVMQETNAGHGLLHVSYCWRPSDGKAFPIYPVSPRSAVRTTIDLASGSSRSYTFPALTGPGAVSGLTVSVSMFLPLILLNDGTFVYELTPTPWSGLAPACVKDPTIPGAYYLLATLESDGHTYVLNGARAGTQPGNEAGYMVYSFTDPGHLLASNAITIRLTANAVETDCGTSPVGVTHPDYAKHIAGFVPHTNWLTVGLLVGGAVANPITKFDFCGYTEHVRVSQAAER